MKATYTTPISSNEYCLRKISSIQSRHFVVTTKILIGTELFREVFAFLMILIERSSNSTILSNISCIAVR